VQLLLPFRPRRSGELLAPERAEAIEAALRETRRLPEGSRHQVAAEQRLLELLRPFLAGAARKAWEGGPRTFLSRADLEGEAVAHVLAKQPWRTFTPGWAGPGRTLYPAYVLQAVRQRLSTVLAEAAPVHVTHWGRKAAARARKRVEREGLELGEALADEAVDAATALALSLGAQRVEEREAIGAEDEGHLRRDELGAQARAVAALQHLPHRQRVAVAGGLGLEREDGRPASDGQLARRLKCTLDELLEAREAGLAALREALA
jgi:hypothetical protein